MTEQVTGSKILSNIAERSLPLSVVLKAISDEPEYPDDPPPELIKYIRQCIANNDESHMLHMLRMAVRQTKECIAERVITSQISTSTAYIIEDRGEENTQLRRVISNCAKAIGGYISVDASLEFMQELPNEIQQVKSKLQTTPSDGELVSLNGDSHA